MGAGAMLASLACSFIFAFALAFVGLVLDPSSGLGEAAKLLGGDTEDFGQRVNVQVGLSMLSSALLRARCCWVVGRSRVLRIGHVDSSCWLPGSLAWRLLVLWACTIRWGLYGKLDLQGGPELVEVVCIPGGREDHAVVVRRE
eukprot:5463238-Amphidinium_carterae.1